VPPPGAKVLRQHVLVSAQSILIEKPESLTRVPEGEHLLTGMVDVGGTVTVTEQMVDVGGVTTELPAEVTNFIWFTKVPPEKAAQYWIQQHQEAEKIADAYIAGQENKIAARFLRNIQEEERRKLEEELNDPPGGNGHQSNWSSRTPHTQQHTPAHLFKSGLPMGNNFWHEWATLH